MNEIAPLSPRWTGPLLVALGAMALGVAGFLPIAAKGGDGIGILYLAGYRDASPLVALPLALFVLAPLAMLLGVLLNFGLLANHRIWFSLCGIFGLLFTVHGIAEGVEHIRMFLGACVQLGFDPSDPSPVVPGSGGRLGIIAYGGMLAAALLPFPKVTDP